jgi:hypothetical protein
MFNACTWMGTLLNSDDSWKCFAAGGTHWRKQNWSSDSVQDDEAARTSETSVDNHFTRRYIPEDISELHTRRRENLKSHIENKIV